jgi:NADPH:quinone reductase-like Zn-dependent oxidoreductase
LKINQTAAPKEEFTLGLEFSGVVVKSFNGSKFNIGDHVFGIKRFGAFSNFVVSEEKFLRPLPKGWSFEEGAALFAQALTAWYGLVELGGLKKNKRVIVHSAAGGVGLFCLDVIKHFNAIPIATIGTDSKKEYLMKEFGLNENQILVRTSGKEFKSEIEEIVNHLPKSEDQGVDIIMDSLGGEYFQPGYDLLNLGGRIVLFGWGSIMTQSTSPNYFSLGWNYIWRTKLDPIQV